MKKILFILISCLSIMTSCVDMLDLYPISNSTKENSYTKPEDFKQLLNSVYAFLQSTGQYGQNFHFLMEVPSDNSKEVSSTVRGGVFYQFEILLVGTDNSVIEASWRDSYKAIQSCNILLERIDQIGMDESDKAITVGEAYFLRALNYFNLVRLFGDLPIVLAETKDPADLLKVGREDKSKVYNQIIIDLNEAIKRLPTAQFEKGRATFGAAYTLLGKVYLTLKQYPEAVEALRKVKGYALMDNYSQIFGTENEYNQESIFEVNFTSNLENEGSALANLFAPTGEGPTLGIVGAVYNQNIPTQELYDLYSSNDKRRDVTIGVVNKKMYAKKYVAPIVKDQDSGINVIVLRYADVILMLAEALNEIEYGSSEALTLLNQIRSRAGLLPYTSSELPDQASFRKAVADERRLELAFENHRWFDLIRTGTAVETMNNSSQESDKFTVEEYQLIYPIPQREINANPNVIKQNPKY